MNAPQQGPHVLIIGGGLAGLSAGCYARRSGFKTTIVEHNLALGGVCTSWRRGPYTIDGCIQWLTGGPFARVYEELDITPAVPLHTLETWVEYRDVARGLTLPITRDLEALFRQLAGRFPDDAEELERMRGAVDRVIESSPPIGAPELISWGERWRLVSGMMGSLPTVAHFNLPLGEYTTKHVRSAGLRRFLHGLLPETAPALMFLWVLGYLQKGWLSRPVGGTAAFRDALVRTYERLGGEARRNSTVDEVLVSDGRARGVRLADGTILEGDAVISTSSAPETVLRLLGGRYDAQATRERLEKWKLFDPIVIASYGIAQPLRDQPALLLLDGVEPFDVGGVHQDRIMLRIQNDDPSFAPPGHAVVQAIARSDYEWWATRGSDYNAEKDVAAEILLSRLERAFDGVASALRVVDVATPLTFWGMARSWRGAYEGWMPSSATFFGHVKKKLAGLDGFYMAGQWVEPGGGVPTAVTSGRQAVELLCDDEQRAFVAR